MTKRKDPSKPSIYHLPKDQQPAQYKDCPVCGRPFNAVYNRQTCSTSCYQKAWKREHSAAIIEKRRLAREAARKEQAK